MHSFAQQAIPEAIYNAHHRIQRIQYAPFFIYGSAAITYRADEQPELHYKRNDVPEVSILYIKRR